MLMSLFENFRIQKANFLGPNRAPQQLRAGHDTKQARWVYDRGGLIRPITANCFTAGQVPIYLVYKLAPGQRALKPM